jgi:hypothetical protein
MFVGLGCSSVIEGLPIMCKAVGFIPKTGAKDSL